jgi:polyhydroxyalkanoate synthase
MSKQPDTGKPAGLDPFEAGRQWLEIAEKAQTVMTQFVDRHISGGPSQAFPVQTDPMAIGRLFTSVLSDPARLGYAQFSFWQRHADLWRNLMKANGDDGAELPQVKDRRFRSEEWQRDVAFNTLMHSYLIGADWLRSLVTNRSDLPAADQKKLTFFAEQLIDATAPTNFAVTNPDVVRKTMETGGANLLKGFSNFLDDLASDAGHVRRADQEAFELGVTIAATKGSVILRTEMMELIQYEPATEKVRKIPLLLLPPWVNKYYLFDLQQKSSFIKWAVDQGFTVFAISWVNPDASHAEKDFEDYWLEGPQAAFAAIEKATGQKKVNLFGYCLGGTLTATGLAYLTERGDDRAASATMVATMTDFSDFGDFEVFVNEENAATLSGQSGSKGYVGSADLSRLFSLLRANDLIWSSAISSYLLADKAVASDLLYWFSDGIGMPARMLETFQRKILLENALAQPGKFKIGTTPIDLTKIRTPLCFVSLKDDHVANWEQTYRGAARFEAPKRFILGGSGHNAGTINPPEARKHGYWTNDEFPPEPGEWLEKAERHEGSWWTEWATWLAKHSGPLVKARPVSDGPLPVLEAAPGSYARVRR